MYYIIIYFHRLPLCAIINDHIRSLATKFPKTKFVRFVFNPNLFNFDFVIKLFPFQVKSLAVLCIPNYPDHNLPTIFVYFNGALKQQIIGPSSFPQALKPDGNKILYSFFK